MIISAIKKYMFFVVFLTTSFAASAFFPAMVIPAVRLIGSGALFTAAYFAAEETKKEYIKASDELMSKYCKPIKLFDDFTREREKKLEKKCGCYIDKYEQVITKAALTILLAGFGFRCGAKGLFKGIL